MDNWGLLVKEVAQRLRGRVDGIEDAEFKTEITLAIALMSMVRDGVIEDIEGGSSEQDEKWSSVVGQCGNVSKIFLPMEISYCQSDDKKVFIIDKSEKCYRTLSTLKDIEQRIPDLIKINQSTLVSKDEIKALEYVEMFSYYLVRLKSGKTFKVSRRSTKKVKEIFYGDSKPDTECGVSISI